MEPSQPRPRQSDDRAGTPGDPAASATDPELRGSSAAPDLDDERDPLKVEHKGTAGADTGDETPGGAPYDPAGSS